MTDDNFPAILKKMIIAYLPLVEVSGAGDGCVNGLYIRREPDRPLPYRRMYERVRIFRRGNYTDTGRTFNQVIHHRLHPHPEFPWYESLPDPNLRKPNEKPIICRVSHEPESTSLNSTKFHKREDTWCIYCPENAWIKQMYGCIKGNRYETNVRHSRQNGGYKLLPSTGWRLYRNKYPRRNADNLIQADNVPAITGS